MGNRRKINQTPAGRWQRRRGLTYRAAQLLNNKLPGRPICTTRDRELSGTRLVGWLLVGMGSRKGLSTLDDTLGLTGKLSRCDRNKQALQNCRAGQGDILARGEAAGRQHRIPLCMAKNTDAPALHPAISSELGTAAPSCSHRPPNCSPLVSAVRLASHDSARSSRILAQTSIQRLAVVLGIACSPPNPPKTAKTLERMSPAGWRQSAARARHLYRTGCTASPAAQCWPGAGTPSPGAGNDVAWVGSEMPQERQ